MPSPAPRDAGLCARCQKDFRLLSRRYNCRWVMGGTGSGDTGVAPGWHCSHHPLSCQGVPGQGVPRVLRGRGQAGTLLPALLPAKAPAGYVSRDRSPRTVSGTPLGLTSDPGIHVLQAGPAAQHFGFEMCLFCGWSTERKTSCSCYPCGSCVVYLLVIAGLIPRLDAGLGDDNMGVSEPSWREPSL